MRPRVFLSHSSKDMLAVERIRAQAEASGVDVYIAEHDVRAGERLGEKILSELRRSDAVVVLLTDNSATAPFVHQEIGAARQGEKLIVPLVQKGLQMDLAMLQGVEYVEFDPEHPEPALLKVTASMTAFVERVRQAEVDRAVAKARADALLIAAGIIILILILSSSSE